MERKMVFGQVSVNVEVEQQACLSCPALYGEMQKALKALNLLDNPAEFKATASCSYRVSKKSLNTKHIEIVLNSDGKAVSADRSIRNWLRREVHCSSDII